MNPKVHFRFADKNEIAKSNLGSFHQKGTLAKALMGVTLKALTQTFQYIILPHSMVSIFKALATRANSSGCTLLRKGS
jgi:hypothetical protein